MNFRASTTYRCLVLVGLSTGLGCTIPTFEHPLVSPSEAKACTELYGSHKSVDQDKSSVLFSHIGNAGKEFPPGFLRMIDVQLFNDPTRPPTRTEIVCFLAQIEGHYLLHLPLNEIDKIGSGSQTNWSGPWDESKVKGYILARLTKRDDYVELAFLSSEFVEDQIKTKKLTGKILETTTQEGVTKEAEKTITVTAKSDELRTFFTNNMNGKLFHKPSHRFSPVK